MELFASHCVFPTPDICKTAEYYHAKLGFRRVDYLNARKSIYAYTVMVQNLYLHNQMVREYSQTVNYTDTAAMLMSS